ncbi:hypothetical protein LCGC14_2929850, partial [marine sediment metagenome]
MNYNVPFSQRSASKILKTVARGSKYNLPEGDTIRLFIWWKDGLARADLDLSAMFLDDDYNCKEQISYTKLKNKNIGAVHSGDITSAPKGASEFIDISIKKCLDKNIRYVMMSVSSYTQQPFYDLPECFAGIMTRQYP